MDNNFNNPFIFDNRPVPCVSVKFRTLLNTKDANLYKLWNSFISKVMREEKSRYKYSQVTLIREYLQNHPNFDIVKAAEYTSYTMRESVASIKPIYDLIDIETLAFVLAISGFNVREFVRNENC